MADGIRIVHESGPLKGERNFGADTREISFGREVTPEDVRYPPGTTAVGGEHFSLKRAANGKYTIEVSPDYQVEVDGKPAKPGMAVRDGMLFRLGRKDGPSFRVHLDGVTKPDGYKKTETQGLFKSTRDLTTGQGNRLRAAVIGGSAIAVILAAGVFLAFRYNEDLQFAWYQDDLMHSAYAVFKVKEKDGRRQSDIQGTAWPIKRGTFVTNTHIARLFDDLKSDETLVIRAPGSKPEEFYRVTSVLKHPDYKAFGDYLDERQLGAFSRQGTENFRFEKYQIINPFDIGLLIAAGAAGVVPALDVADQEEIDALAPDTEVLYFGYPFENDMARAKADERPVPVPIRGRIARAENDFGFPVGDGERASVFSMKLDAIGGASGSPVMLSNGHIIGLIGGGTVSTVYSRDKDGKAVFARLPTGVGLTIVPRADRWAEIETRKPEEASLADVWNVEVAQLDSWTDVVGKARSALDAALPAKNACAADEAIAPARVKLPKVESGGSRHQYKLHVEAGRTYGFLGYAEGNAMITLQLSGSDKKRLSKAVEDVKFPELVYTPAASGDITLTVEGASETVAEIYQACAGKPAATATTAVGTDATTPGAD